MSKQFRYALLAVAVVLVGGAVLVLGPGSQALFAQGSRESDEGGSGDTERVVEETEAGGGSGNGTVTGGLAVLEAELVRAVELATRTPEDWDYDPKERHIFAEDADIAYPVRLSDAEWKEILDPNAYQILRQKGTEPAFTHPLNDNKRSGIYYSRATGQPLFSSEDKYDSRSGWPSFTRPINPHAIVYVEDNSLFSQRIEVVDSLSGSHLGHVFSDGPRPTGQRYCINGAALVFVPDGEEPPPLRTAAR